MERFIYFFWHLPHFKILNQNFFLYIDRQIDTHTEKWVDIQEESTELAGQVAVEII